MPGQVRARASPKVTWWFSAQVKVTVTAKQSSRALDVELQQAEPDEQHPEVDREAQGADEGEADEGRDLLDQGGGRPR